LISVLYLDGDFRPVLFINACSFPPTRNSFFSLPPFFVIPSFSIEPDLIPTLAGHFFLLNADVWLDTFGDIFSLFLFFPGPSLPFSFAISYNG